MKKWQLILCSLGVSFIPSSLVAIGYTHAFLTFGLQLSLVPYLPMLLGLFFSYMIYNDFKEMVIK